MTRKLAAGVGILLILALAASAAVRLWLRSDAIRDAVERQASAALGMPVRIAGARAALFPRLRLELQGVRVGEPARAEIDEIAVAAGLRLLVSRQVDEADIRVAGGHLESSLLGVLSARQPAQPPTPATRSGPAGAVTINSIRSIRLVDVAIAAGETRIPTSLEASLEGSRLAVQDLTARLGDTTLRAEGALDLDRREGQFEARADLLPLDALAGAVGAFADAAGEQADQGRTSPAMAVTARVTAPVATLGPRRLEAFEARLRTEPSGWVIDPVTFSIEGGRVEARVRTDPAAGGALDVRGTASGLDASRLRAAGPAGGPGVTGRLDARFALRVPSGAGAASLMEAARGTIDLALRDGTMPGIRVIRQAVIGTADRARPAPAAKATDAFSRVDASLVLQAGPDRIASLAMQASDFDLSGTGTLSMPDGRISLDVDLTLSEALSREAGRDLYRYAREGRRIVVPATIGGTLAEPTASVDLAEAARRALRNRVEDEARSLLDRLIKKNPR